MKSGWNLNNNQNVLVTLPGLSALFTGGMSLFTSPSATAVTALIALGPVPLLLAGSYTVLASDIPTLCYRRILTWSGVGAAGLVIVSIGLILAPDISINSPAPSLSLSFGLGAFAGLLVGFNEARAIERAREAERNRVEIENAERQNERLERLNHLLRHDILNNMMVIQGHAEFLLDDSDRDTGHAETVLRQAEATTELIQNVRAYLDSVNQQGGALQSENLSEILEREVTTLKASFSDATVETDIPRGVHVRADGLVGSVFSNLLRNAVVHNNSADPNVQISVSRTGDFASVRVADNGPGLPDSVQQELFEAGEHGDHGFGLFLVGTLVDQYNGSVKVERTGEDGTVFKVELPLIDSSSELSRYRIR